MKRQRPKFEKPLKPWNKQRIEEERELSNKYGLRRKHEIWKSESILRKYRRLARKLLASEDKKQEEAILKRLIGMGILPEGAKLEDVLSLKIEDVLERRLQTLVQKKGITKTLKQARQYIVHGHIAVSGVKAKWPSMLVPKDQESAISVYEKSKIKG